MNCSICKKNEATIHFKGQFDKKAIKLFICSDCARKTGMSNTSKVSIPEFISAISDLGDFSRNKGKKVLSCPSCGLTYAEFKYTGRLGCGNCYHVYKHYLEDLLVQIHGKTEHKGKKIQKFEIKEEFFCDNIDDLKKELENAVKGEHFERAAEIRDRIERIKNRV